MRFKEATIEILGEHPATRKQNRVPLQGMIGVRSGLAYTPYHGYCLEGIERESYHVCSRLEDTAWWHFTHIASGRSVLHPFPASLGHPYAQAVIVEVSKWINYRLDEEAVLKQTKERYPLTGSFDKKVKAFMDKLEFEMTLIQPSLFVDEEEKEHTDE